MTEIEKKKWADYTDDEDSLNEVHAFNNFKTLKNEDTYIGAPLSELQNSKLGLNVAFNKLTKLEPSGPTDFSCLMDESEQWSEYQKQCAKYEKKLKTYQNAFPTINETIKTQFSMPEDKINDDSCNDEDSRMSIKRRSLEYKESDIKRHKIENIAINDNIFDNKTDNYVKTRKNKPMLSCNNRNDKRTYAKKPPKLRLPLVENQCSDNSQPVGFLNFFQYSSRTDHSSPSLKTCDESLKAKNNQNNELQRVQQRRRQLAISMMDKCYQTYIRNIPHEERTSDDPVTPDPTRNMSQRQWQQEFALWKTALHKKSYLLLKSVQDEEELHIRDNPEL